MSGPSDFWKSEAEVSGIGHTVIIECGGHFGGNVRVSLITGESNLDEIDIDQILAQEEAKNLPKRKPGCRL